MHVAVGNKSATTHSYMVMPYLDMGGGVGKLLYLKSSEASGKWPQNMATPQGNVYFKVYLLLIVFFTGVKVFPGKTAMMTSRDLEVYLGLLLEDLIASGRTKALLLCDSWSSNKDQELFSRVQKNFEDMITVEKMVIPGGKFSFIYQLCLTFLF